MNKTVNRVAWKPNQTVATLVVTIGHKYSQSEDICEGDEVICTFQKKQPLKQPEPTTNQEKEEEE